MLVSHEVWSACRRVAERLPRSIRIELRSEPDELRIATDARRLRSEVAALLYRACTLLRVPSGVLALAVRVARECDAASDSAAVAWIELRLFADRARCVDPQVGGEGEGPGRSKGGRPARAERLEPSHLLPLPRTATPAASGTRGRAR